MSQQVSRVSQKGYSNNVKSARTAQITVKQGDTVSSLAKKYGMSKDEFMNWAGLNSTALKIGQKITLPTDTVPQGKGIIALAKKHNMTLDEFCRLNGITKDYKPAKGEIFYVKSKKAGGNAQPASPTKQNPSKPRASAPVKPSAPRKPVLSPAQQNQAKWGSPYTPQEIANKLKSEAEDKWGAVGKKPFDDMLAQINPKNVAEVIKAYDSLNTGETLINMITSEVNSSKDKRKAAVMHVYDALATAKSTPAAKRNEFKEILDKEFSKWVGMVDTKKLDSMITQMLNSTPVSSSDIKANVTGDKTKIIVSKGGSFTAAELQRSAIASAKNEAKEKFKEYCRQNNIKYDPNNLDLSPMNRIPAPIHNGSTLISYNSGLLKPTGKPNGKVVILNPGHGGYSSKNGYFDVGAYSFIKKANGKYAPMLEYEKMKDYAQKAANALRAQGYAVVIANSHVDTMSSDNLLTNLVSSLNKGQMGGQKYDTKNISFVSLHADSEPGKSGTGICFDPNSPMDVKFKDSFLTSLNNDDWISAKGSERPNLHVIKKTGNIPSVLIEVEYVNGSKSKNLDSGNFQKRFINSLISGLNNYYGEK